MNKMCEVILLGSTWETHIHFHDIGFEVRGDQIIDAEVHSWPK